MSERLELRILGPLELLRDGRPVPVGGVKPRQLLATLALHHGRTVSVDHLIDVLWPEDPPRSAVANVHTYVSRLRTQIGEERLRRQPPGYRLDLGPEGLDAARFIEYAQVGAIDDALALWRGDPVEDLPASPRWRTEVNRLIERYRTVRQSRCRRLIEAGDPHSALSDLRMLVAEDPLREESWLLLVTALEATGQRAEALATYSSARRILATELGIEPAEPLRRLHERLLTDRPLQPASTAARLDAGAAAVLRALALLGPEPTPGWVAAAALDRAAPAGVLETLAEARLIRRAGVDRVRQERFRLPALVLLLATELPCESETALLQRVLGGYLTLAEQATEALGGQIFGPGRKVARRWPVPAPVMVGKDPLDWFDVERRSLLNAVRLATRTEQAALAWELAHTLVPWYDLTGQSADWEQTHRDALAVCRQTGDLLGEAVILRGIGQLHLYRDEYEPAQAAFSRARLGYARLGLRHGEAGALAGLGAVCRIRGELATAGQNYQEALDAYRSVGNRAGEAYAHGGLGMVCLAQRELAEAERWLRAGLRIAEEIGDRHRAAHLTHQLGLVRLHSGEPDRARRLLLSALDRFSAIGDAHGQAYCGSDLAGLERGDRAVQRLTEALAVFERIGDRSAQARTARHLGQLHRDAGQEGLSRAYLAEARRLGSAVGPAGTGGGPRESPVD